MKVAGGFSHRILRSKHSVPRGTVERIFKEKMIFNRPIRGGEFRLFFRWLKPPATLGRPYGPKGDARCLWPQFFENALPYRLHKTSRVPLLLTTRAPGGSRPCQ